MPTSGKQPEFVSHVHVAGVLQNPTEDHTSSSGNWQPCKTDKEVLAWIDNVYCQKSVVLAGDVFRLELLSAFQSRNGWIDMD